MPPLPRQHPPAMTTSALLKTSTGGDGNGLSISLVATLGLAVGSFLGACCLCGVVVWRCLRRSSITSPRARLHIGSTRRTARPRARVHVGSNKWRPFEDEDSLEGKVESSIEIAVTANGALTAMSGVCEGVGSERAERATESDLPSRTYAGAPSSSNGQEEEPDIFDSLPLPVLYPREPQCSDSDEESVSDKDARAARQSSTRVGTQGSVHSNGGGMSTSQGAAPAASHALSREKRAGYRADVDGLRAVAVIAVIVFHLDESYLPGGFTGVDSFFVISGFVVSSTLLSRPAPSAAQLLLGFYSRRVQRLMPALVVTVLATAITISMVVPPEAGGLDSYYASAQLALVGMANNIYAAQTTGYWERGQQTMEFNPFTHMWSLGVEGAWLHCKNPPQALAHIA